MEPRFDFHVHTHYLRCANGTMTIPAEGCRFSVGSDAHDISQLAGISQAWEMVRRLKLPPERIWSPPGAPFRAAVPA